MRTFALLLIFAFGGCAFIDRSEERGVEQRLKQAGFEVVPTTPAELARITPYEVAGKVRAGRVVYRYADPEKGRLYEGGEREYERYRDATLRLQARRVSNLAQIGPRRTTGPLLW